MLPGSLKIEAGDRQVRQFGAIAAVALPAVGWWWGGGAGWIAVLAAVGVTVAAAAWAAPWSVRPIYVGLTCLTAPIGMVVGEIILLAIYGLLFVPLGLAFRLVGRDPLECRRDPGADSYFRRLEGPRPAASYYRQW